MNRPGVALAAALALGAAGYAAQGRPGLGATFAKARVLVWGDPAEWVELRSRFYGPAPGKAAAWLFPADAMVRHGEFADAAAFLQGAVAKHPRDAEAWLALANALTLHAQGRLTPAAAYAYRRAIEAGPHDPAPPFFYARALDASGDAAAARRLRSLAVPPSAIAGGKPCC